jgi:hypothetical protein
VTRRSGPPSRSLEIPQRKAASEAGRNSTPEIVSRSVGHARLDPVAKVAIAGSLLTLLGVLGAPIVTSYVDSTGIFAPDAKPNCVQVLTQWQDAVHNSRAKVDADSTVLESDQSAKICGLTPQVLKNSVSNP